MSDQPQTISIPSLVVLAALGLLAVRYFFFTPASTSSRPPNSRAANPADIEQVATMFPQIPRRDIIWDLQRNGGSVPATTERILARGSLDTVRVHSLSIRGNGKGCVLHRIIDSLTSHLQPPPTFQPPSLASSTPSTTNTTAPKPPRPEHIDLIKRYNLGSKISSTPSAPEEAGWNLQQTWSNNKNERQALLQRRREEMVLNARRKMEEREREKSRR